MPYDSYLLYQAGRPKSAEETTYADKQIGEFAAAASAVLRGITRPRHVARAFKRWAPA